MGNPDEELIEGAQQGDVEALTMIYNTYHPSIYRYVYFRLADQQLAEDIAAEVFVRMVEKISTYQPRGKPILAWLYTIARNLVVDFHASRTREDASWRETSPLENGHPQPSQLVERRQDLETLLDAMSQLNEDQRMFILLKFGDEFSTDEIALIMGRNERAVRSLQHRALASLGRFLNKEVPDET
jgi:RNA polymerase sigma-70 factor (ECF subfamily)